MDALRSNKRPMGMTAFLIIWFGQVVSQLGSSMTGFGLTIWAYEKTGQATPLALAGFFWVAPLILISPFAGALIDRSNRKLMMMVSDLASGCVTIWLLTMFATGRLQIWNIYVGNLVSGTFQAFQWPAFSATFSLMLPKKQYGRASALMELAGPASNIFAPVAAGALLGIIRLSGIMFIDIVTFVFAVGVLLFVHIPQPPVTEAGLKGRGSLWSESGYGFRYIFQRPSLLGLQLVFMVGNLFAALAFAVFPAMILARSGNNSIVFGTVQSAGAIGGLVGGLTMSAWGGTKRKVHGVLGGWILSGLCGLALGLGRSLPAWAVALFCEQFIGPIVNASNQAIWQAKVAPDVQGRVFSVRRMIAWSFSLLSQLVAGPLADRVFEPAMRQGGRLSGTFGRLVGTGPGAGMGLMFLVAGVGAVLAGTSGYFFRRIRDAESLLPDHELAAEAAPAPEPALEVAPDPETIG